MPVKDRVPSFGAVRDNRAAGVNDLPLTLPFSTSQADGISTDTMGLSLSLRAAIGPSNGGRGSPLKEKPKMASRTTVDW